MAAQVCRGALISCLAMLAMLNGACHRRAADAVRAVSGPDRVLRLVLDADGDLDPFNILDDAQTFLPGLYADGSSRPTGEVCGPSGQVARVIAIFVNSSNPHRAIPPPPATRVSFSLEKTTAHRGCANNVAGSDVVGPDYVLFQPGAPDTHTLTVSFGRGYLAQAHVRVRDYGGFTEVRATTSDGHQATVQLPLDADGNRLPDIGWKASGVWVH